MILISRNLIIKDCDENEANKLIESLSLELSKRAKIKKLFSFKRKKNSFFLVASSTSKDGSIDILNVRDLILFKPAEIKILGIALGYSSATKIIEELTDTYLKYKNEDNTLDKVLSMKEFYSRRELFED